MENEMSKKVLNELLRVVNTLSNTEQKKLVDNIMEMMRQTNVNSCSSIVTEHIEGKPDCPHCNAKASLGEIIKRGFKNGVQRYYCKHCKKVFMPTTNTTFAYTRKDADTWRKFIYLTITGESLSECSRECKIAYQTAFTWRHKVLNAFVKNQSDILMEGTVQMDELFIPLSFKGNHVQGKFGVRTIESGDLNDMPRPSYKRGSDNKSNSINDKACVCCMVEDGNKTYFASVPGVGGMKDNMLDSVVGKHINKEKALVLTDKYQTTKSYLSRHNYKFKTFKSNITGHRNDHKPEIDGDLHIQHINSMHFHLRVFLKKYYGVSSKYLNNYVALFVWLKQIKLKQKSKIKDLSITRASVADCFITLKELQQYPAIPCCA